MSEPTVEPRRDRHGRVVGSRVVHGAKVYELPQYPKRVRAVEERPDGSVAVHFEHGHERVLDPDFDAVR
jgi:hypothetical protein